MEKITRTEFVAKYFPRTREEHPGIWFTILPVMTSISDEELERLDTVIELKALTLQRYIQMFEGFQQTMEALLNEIKAADVAEKIILTVN